MGRRFCISCIVQVLVVANIVCTVEAAPGDWIRPVISSATRSGTLERLIAENQPVGQTLSYLEVEGATSYTITYQPTDGLFVIQNNGSINITSKLDYENITSYSIVVESLTSTMTSTATITINIEDKNDNVPVFDGEPYFVRVPDNITEGTLVTKVSATDADRSFNYRFINKYTIRDGQDKDYFFIVPSSGEIYVAKDRKLSASIKKNYTISVQADDTGVPNRLGTADVTVCAGCLPLESGAIAVGSSALMIMAMVILSQVE